MTASSVTQPSPGRETRLVPSGDRDYRTGRVGPFPRTSRRLISGVMRVDYERSWAPRSQVRRAVFDYIERFFNRVRLHSSLSYLTPTEYEAKIHHHKAAHAA
jgi:transposase InsO family protein